MFRSMIRKPGQAKTLVRTGDERVAVTGDLQEGQELLVKEVKVNTNNNKKMGPPM